LKKLLALLLALIIFSSSLLTLAACGDGTVDDGTTPGDGSTDGDGTEGGDGGTVNGDGENGEENKGEEKDESTAIVVPEYKDYQRDTVNFDELVYERPDISATIAVFEDLAKKVEENALPVNELIALITESEEPYVKLLSMSSLSHIYHSKDSSNEYWLGEYDYISTNYPAFSQAVEKLLLPRRILESGEENRQSVTVPMIASAQER